MLEIILVVLALIAIIGACIYFYTDMKDHKATNNTDFEKVNKNIEEEETTRLGNIKYVVDQVNNTNTAMDTEYNNRFKKLEDTDTGFGKLIVAVNANNGVVPFKDVTDDSKLKLMRDVSVIGSMSIKDLETTKSFKACGNVAGAPCIEFPDSKGNTYLTGLSEGTSVVSGSMFEANAGLKTDSINNLADGPLTIQTGTTAAPVNTIKVSNTTTDGIKLTSGTSSIEIKDGAINIRGNIKLNDKAIKVVGVGPTGFTDVTQVLTFAATEVIPQAPPGASQGMQSVSTQPTTTQ